MLRKGNSAEFQLLKLIKHLSLNKQRLNTMELLSVIKATKSIYSNGELIDILTKSLNTLSLTKIKNTVTLTARESEVLGLIGQGFQSSEIAELLQLSKSTIETHRKNIIKKLKISRHGKLLEYAIFNNLYKNIKTEKSTSAKTTTTKN